jgi:hypothetical protein
MKVSLCLFFALLTIHLSAQQKWWNQVSLSFEYRDKMNLYSLKEESLNPISVKRPIRSSNFAFLLRYRLTERLSLETGYWQELFVAGFQLPTYYNLSTRYIGEAGDMIPLRCNVDVLRTPILKRVFTLSSSLGSVFGLSKVRDKERYSTDYETGDSGVWSGGAAGDLRSLSMDRNYTYGQEYGFAKVYVLFEGRAEASYEIFPATILYGGLSYTLGTQPLGRVSIDYSESMAPSKNILMVTRGNSHAWFAGIRVDLKNLTK